MSDERPHAVLMPFPSQGHISPFIHLCRALACRGFVVSFVSVETSLPIIRSSFPEEDLDIRHETVPDNLPVPLADFDPVYQDNRVQFLKATEDMGPQFEELLVNKISSKGPPVTCLILDSLFNWKQDVGRSYGIPTVMYWTASITPLLLSIHIDKLVENGDIPVQDPSSSKLITYLPGLPALPTWSLPHDVQAGNPRYDPKFPYKRAISQRIIGADMIIFNTFEELETEALKTMRETINPRSFAIGPVFMLDECLKRNLTTASLWKEDRQCLDWLNTQETGSVLYVSFGSLATLEREQVEMLAAGLEELQQPYLWVFRFRSGTKMSIEEFDELKLRVGKSGGLLVPWVPQLEVLMHPAIGGFVTHCGWNSVLESISAGVPLLCWPCFAEQNLNCKLLVEDHKVALKFSKNVPSKEEFVELARKLMGTEGSELRTNAKVMKETIKTATATGSSQKNLEEFIRAFANIAQSSDV